MISEWLIIVLAIVALWILWQLLNLVSDMIEIWHAARRGEDMSSDREKVSSQS